jgi:hypothetical protein
MAVYKIISVALTSPTSSGRSVGIVRTWTQATEFVLFVCILKGTPQHTRDNISLVSWLEKLSTVADVLVPWASDTCCIKNSAYWSMSWPYKSQLDSCLKNTT